MYEKNCLTHVTISQIEKAPYTIVLQKHPASTIQWKQVVKKVYDIEPKCTMHQLKVKSALALQDSWVRDLFQTIKGPCTVICMSSFENFQTLIKILHEPKTKFPCTIVSASISKTVLVSTHFKTLANNVLQWEDIFCIQYTTLNLLNTWMHPVHMLLNNCAYRANNGN